MFVVLIPQKYLVIKTSTNCIQQKIILTWMQKGQKKPNTVSVVSFLPEKTYSQQDSSLLKICSLCNPSWLPWLDCLCVKQSMHSLSSSSTSSQKSAERDGRKGADQAWDCSELRTKLAHQHGTPLGLIPLVRKCPQRSIPRQLLTFYDSPLPFMGAAIYSQEMVLVLFLPSFWI